MKQQEHQTTKYYNTEIQRVTIRVMNHVMKCAASNRGYLPS